MPCNRHSSRIAVRRPTILSGKRSISVTVLVTMVVLSGLAGEKTSQDPVIGKPGVGTDGWGESRVEEIVAALEKLYIDTQMRKRIGARGAEWILEHRRTWSDHANDLQAHLLSLL